MRRPLTFGLGQFRLFDMVPVVYDHCSDNCPIRCWWWTGRAVC